ncbi:MAG: hypothetical protein IPL46_33565 [Saprospiraceae bacterium]|nr:hypothetical protein [Saprospiraceae bacterium]
MLYYFALILALALYPLECGGSNIGFESISIVEKSQSTLVSANLLSENLVTESFGCPVNVYLDSGTINPGFYQASNQIIATVSIPTGTVMLRAGNEILLENGFEVQTGARLEVEMGECIF